MGDLMDGAMNGSPTGPADGWRLTGEQVRAWLTSLLGSGRRVIAPVTEDGLLLFREIADAGQARIEPSGRTRWSVKEYLFPPSEPLLAYWCDGDGVRIEEPPPPPEQVLAGPRPCDAAGIARLDDLLGADEIYRRRRERTTIVSVACASAGPACFCTATGGSPAGTEGSDLQLVPAGPDWLLLPLTDRGAALTDGHAGDWPVVTAADLATAADQGAAVAESIGAAPWPAGLPADLAGRFESEIWQRLGERCLGCGICVYACPSCGCFDVTDQGDIFSGIRCRSWDSCGLARFTRHAAGHNPRPAQPARYRQRVLHKLAWFPLEHGAFMCVGCGRCVELCPAGLDIRQSPQVVIGHE